jgi:hypothetical protein
MQAPALNAPVTLFPNDLVRSDAVLRASPLGPVSSLNRTFGSAATGTPGARRRPDADPRAAAGPHLASAANTGNRDEERNHDALRRFRHNPNRASGRLNPAFVMIEGARQGRLLPPHWPVVYPPVAYGCALSRGSSRRRSAARQRQPETALDERMTSGN